MSERPALRPVTGLSLQSLPAPPRRVPPARPSPASEDKGGGSPATAETQQGSARTPRSGVSVSPPSSGTSSAIRAISVSLAVPLAELLKLRARTAGEPKAQIVLDAVLEARHELSGLVADRRRAGEWTDELFVRTAAAATEPRTTVSLRMLARNVEALDDLVEQTGAASRSELITLALKGVRSEPENQAHVY